MRLSVFRERILREIQEAAALDESDQMIQPYLVCIAAMLRAIISRTGFDPTIEIKEYLGFYDTLVGETRDARMREVINWVLHYKEFSPTFDVRLGKTRRVCTILADRDSQVFRRVIDIDEFLSIARKLVDSEEIFPHLVSRFRRCADRIIHSDEGLSRKRQLEGERYVLEALIDVMDVARKSRTESLEGELDAYHEVLDNMRVVEVQKRSVEYETIVQNLFDSWTLVPFRQFTHRQIAVGNTTVQGRMKEVHTSGRFQRLGSSDVQIGGHPVTLDGAFLML